MESHRVGHDSETKHTTWAAEQRVGWRGLQWSPLYPGLPAEWMWGREGWELIRGLTENVGTVWI